MTYDEIKKRLTEVETALQSMHNYKSSKLETSYTVKSIENLNTLKESLQKQLAEKEETMFISTKGGDTKAVAMDRKSAMDLKKDPNITGIDTAKGQKIKEQEGINFSVEETKAIAKSVGKALAIALKKAGDEIARMKARRIEENSFDINVVYKGEKGEDEFSFYISEDTLHLVDFSFDKELVDVGVKPSGEAIVNVDVLANELLKHFKSLNEQVNEVNYDYYTTPKHFDICPGAEALRDEVLASGKTPEELGEWTFKHDELFRLEKAVLKANKADERHVKVAKDLAGEITHHSRDLGIEANKIGYLKGHIKKIEDVAKKTDGRGDNMSLRSRDIYEGEGDDHHYLKVSRRDYKKAMSILDQNVDPTYVKMDTVDDDGAGNVIIYFIFKHEYGFDDMYDDPEGKENPELYQEPDEDPHAFMYDVVMDLQAQGIEVVDHSAELDENVTQKHIDDIEASGNIDIAYKKAMELLKSMLTKNEALDINDPALMRARVAKMRADDLKKLDAYKKSPEGRAAARAQASAERKEEKAREIVRKLKIKRAEIEREMENDPDIEPQGGPVADMYGDQLNKIDNAIEKAASVYNKPMDYDTAVGLRENQPTVFDDESFDALRDIILKYVEDPDDAEAAVQQVDDHGLDSLAPELIANLERDPEFEAWYHKLHYGSDADTDYMQRRRAEKDYMEEDTDVGHQDDEPGMLKSTSYEIATYAAKLYKKLAKYDQVDGEVDFPNWWQSKLILAKDYVSKAYHYLDSEEKQPIIDKLALEHAINESTDLFRDDKFAFTRFSMGKEGPGLQVTDLKKLDEYIHVSGKDLDQFVKGLMKAVRVFDDMKRQLPVDEVKAAKVQKAYSLVVAKMKELAKQYKAGDKSVVPQLKDLTAKKKALEADLERAVAGTHQGQELTELSTDQRNDLVELQNILDDVAQKGEEAREIIRQSFPRMLSKADAYGAFDFGSSANRYDTTLESIIEEIEEYYDEEEDDIDEGKYKSDAQRKAIYAAKAEKNESFKVGDKVTYLGHPGEITKVNKEMTGAITYNVAYNKGNGRTKATNIYNKGGEIKAVKEALQLVHVYDKDGKMYGTGSVEKVEGDKTTVRFDGSTVKRFPSDRVKPVKEAELSKAEKSKLKDMSKSLKKSSKGHAGQAKYLDKLVKEQKATCCGRCGRVHVKGTKCKSPYLKGKDHCRYN